jgi:hypothetical protein
MDLETDTDILALKVENYPDCEYVWRCADSTNSSRVLCQCEIEDLLRLDILKDDDVPKSFEEITKWINELEGILEQMKKLTKLYYDNSKS